MATIKDVAAKAGVSVSVVSKAFNNYADVNEKTRQRIFAVAEELNYSPNIVAKNLSSKKQRTIGLISSGVLNNNEKDTNAFDIFKGVYTALEETQYELSIFLIDSQKQKQKSYAQFCRERNIGGTILQGMRTDDPYFKELIDTKLPVVYVDIITGLENKLIGSVSIDNRKASFEIASHLLERNHRDIVIMAGTKETFVNMERIKGVEEAFYSYGLELTNSSVLFANFSEEEAYLLAKDYLKKKRPTAFLCFSDLMAFGVIRAVTEAGLSIPEDVSVTGFDNLVFSNYSNPKLTTVQQDFVEIGRQAAILLQNLMNNKVDKNQVFVEHELVSRDSVRTLE
ncbi:LacI family DNA-binding transcriptional regulator [Ornithinibacillus halotolerans]|uniref:LacI family transcriptional regulator n=1 Tax=Ornithinibacillus halotolerans TaxID=1274357 RepID=A0A916W763_9BACI|nr:LacI family DNA-binding transcriptional regulator [Ornithinibacillus halotolerans]GGA71515.1 LacI family transcriptional regulator [Ornithinibacillus halotolerans]